MISILLPTYNGETYIYQSIQSVINQIRLNYGVFFEALERYPYTADRMCDEYLELFNELISQRADIIKKRRLWRSPWKVLRNQIAI